MIIEFSISNFRSIKAMQTLSLRATSIISKDKSLDEDNIFETGIDDTKLLKSLIIYGANGSGKSNLIHGFFTMLYFIEDSFRDENAAKEILNPFVLDRYSKNKPTFYQIVFILNKQILRYGFELKKGKVVSEWLFGPASKNEVYYFTRELSEIKVNKNSFPEGIGLEKDKTKETTLFLNVLDAFNTPVSKEIKKFFRTRIGISSGMNDLGLRRVSLQMLDEPNQKKVLIKFLSMADFGINNLENVFLEEDGILEEKFDEAKGSPVKNKKVQILLSERKVIDAKGQTIDSIKESFDIFESEGTKKYFNYAGAILNSITKGMTLIIDEFDSRLHPLLTKKIVQLFNSKVNKNKAQLIIVTHDTNLLDSALFRRDQIYFVEKKKSGESQYYSLVNIRGIRNDATYQKDYIKGKYGAIPFVGQYKFDK